mmetsp:Transcript_10100/g.24112  ORF Transcript_10100/g.24112 Transcript_10100/m.24112 type:complete len:111 (+) Transcript_10100:3693-4025(+)
MVRSAGDGPMWGSGRRRGGTDVAADSPLGRCPAKAGDTWQEGQQRITACISMVAALAQAAECCAPGWTGCVIILGCIGTVQPGGPGGGAIASQQCPNSAACISCAFRRAG